MAALLTLDDRDPQIQYLGNGQWILGGVPTEYNRTTTGTTAQGATVVIPFTGMIQYASGRAIIQH